MMILILADEQVNLGESEGGIKTGGAGRPANDFFSSVTVMPDMGLDAAVRLNPVRYLGYTWAAFIQEP